MATLVLPVANGILPRPHGGKIAGVFERDAAGVILDKLGSGQDILICPWIQAENRLFPVGVLTRILRIWTAEAVDEMGQSVEVIMAAFEGIEHGQWRRLFSSQGVVFASQIEKMNFSTMRHKYPVISGAGWVPEGGYTEFRSQWDLPVTIYGYELENGDPVEISGNLGRLVNQEQAHTIEHAIIRSLNTYGVCTAKTLIDSIAREADELKFSLELGFRFALPEVLGLTESGACGNQMTNLAQFYMHQEIIDSINEGQSIPRAIDTARRRTMSQITNDLGLTTQSGLRVLQGLKKGMSHDDTPIKLETSKKILKCFQATPWG